MRGGDLGLRTVKRRLPDDHLVEDDPDRVEIGRRAHDAALPQLLGRHVAHRAEHEAGAGLGAFVVVLGFEHLGDAEVDDLDGIILLLNDQDVGGLEVAVDEPERVRVGERVEDAGGDDDRAAGREAVPGAQHALERAAGHELERHEQRVVGLSVVKDPHDVVVAQPFEQPRLLREARAGVGVVALGAGADGLDGDVAAAVLDVDGAVDGAEAAEAEDVEDEVGVGEALAEQGVGAKPLGGRGGHEHRLIVRTERAGRSIDERLAAQHAAPLSRIDRRHHAPPLCSALRYTTGAGTNSGADVVYARVGAPEKPRDEKAVGRVPGEAAPRRRSARRCRRRGRSGCPG